jgi:hypothetical protein
MRTSRYHLSSSYQVEFVKLRPKLRPIREYAVDAIIEIIFERVAPRVIRSAKDFRSLGRVFLRATANERELYAFLSDPDMTVGELEANTTETGFALNPERSTNKIKAITKAGQALSPPERLLLLKLKHLLADDVT